MSSALPRPSDKWIPWYFVLFFAVIAVVDGVFVYVAITTQPGVVTEQAYEKGLAFNDVLAKAKAQPDLNQKAVYEDGFLRWELMDADNTPITNAAVIAKIIRSVQDGYDFEIALIHKGHGLYETVMDLPLPGQWVAKLSGTWDNKQYQTIHTFIAK